MDIRIILPVVVTVFGAYLLFKLRFFFILHPVRTLKRLFSASKSGRGVKGLALALAGTLGVGNIIGVAVGISVGGAGSLFWLLLSSLFATVLKYAESTLGADASQNSHGGMSYVIEASFGKIGRPTARIYAFLCLLLALFMGAALQGASAADCLEDGFGISGAISAPVLIFLVLFSIIRGADKIEGITASVIPLTTIIYIFLSLSAVFSNIHRIPEVLRAVVSEAFSVSGAAGGALGFISSVSVREGFSRGLLSNEAGAGTSSMAHARGNSSPTGAGLFGMCEVFFDTVLLCTLTALAILVSCPEGTLGRSPAELVLKSVGASFGECSRLLVCLAIFFFAYSTVICWYFYGSECISFLFRSGGGWFMPLFLFFTLLGCLLDVGAFVGISDVILLFMTVISSSAVIKSSDRLLRLSEEEGLVSRRCRGRRTLPRR